MFTPLMVAYQFFYQLIFGPMLIITLALCLILRLKFPSYKAEIGWTLLFVGILEALMTFMVVFLWGLVIALFTLAIGAAVVTNSRKHGPQTQCSPKKLQLTNVLYVALIAVIIVSAFVFSLRVTNLVHEQWPESYHGGSTSNLALRGIITDVKLNYEVNTGYSYHIFPAILTLDVANFVWGSDIYNQTDSARYWENQNIVIYFEKSTIPKLSVGQQIEVKGYYTPWIEDSLYSNKLVVSPVISQSGIHPL